MVETLRAFTDAGHAPALDVDEAYAQADRVTRRNSQTFYMATALLPREARRAVRALYAFCRATDDLVDRQGATSADVARWRAAVNRPAEEQADPVLLAWALTRARFGVDRRHEAELIDGVAQDLSRVRYATWAELERYCYLVASTVGLLAMPILGLARGARLEEAAPFAIQLGVALQLTNILRDVGEDAAHGRVYLPESDLARFGLTDADILCGTHDARFIALMQFEIARARQLYEAALPGVALLSPAARPAVGAAALLYKAILNRIESLGYQVHSQRASTSARQKLLMLPGVLWQVATQAPPRFAP